MHVPERGAMGNDPGESEPGTEKSKPFQDFCRSLSQRGLVLFLGAGVTAARLPTWNQLLGSLLQSALDWRLSDCSKPVRKKVYQLIAESDFLSVYEKASVVKQFLGPQYLSVLREKLYARRATTGKGNMTDLLKPVVGLCQSPRVIAVVSYSYDDELERAMNKDGKKVDTKEGRRAYSVFGARQAAYNSTDLPVYHVHGFLEKDEYLGPSQNPDIVLSQDEYFEYTLQPFTWQTTTQLHFLRNYTCLFVGASMRDANMARVLGHAKSYTESSSVYALMCEQSLLDGIPKAAVDWTGGGRNSEGGTRVRNLLIRIRGSVFQDMGVELVYTGRDFGSMGVFLTELRGRLNRLKKQTGTREVRKNEQRDTRKRRA